MKITRNNKIDVVETIKYHAEELIVTALSIGAIVAFIWVVFNVAFPA